MARWLTVDPGSKMASGELRVLQDDYYKTSDATNAPELKGITLSSGSKQDPS